MQLDTFNNRVLLGFDAAINITSVNASGFVLQSGSNSITLGGSVVSFVNASCLAFSYGSNVESFVDGVFASWSPITISIGSTAYVFATPVFRVDGQFSVQLYCLFRCIVEFTDSDVLQMQIRPHANARVFLRATMAISRLDGSSAAVAAHSKVRECSRPLLSFDGGFMHHFD